MRRILVLAMTVWLAACGADSAGEDPLTFKGKQDLVNDTLRTHELRAGDAADWPDQAGPGAPGPPAGVCELTAAGVNLSSPNYRLKLFVAPARPVGHTKSDNYQLRLGPPGL